MKALRIKKPLSLIAVILFALLLAFATLSQADDSVMVVKGSIVSVDPNSGKVAVIDDAGKTVMLKAGPENDLKTIQKRLNMTKKALFNPFICKINFGPLQSANWANQRP